MNPDHIISAVALKCSNFQKNATLKLLIISIPISISCTARVYITSLLLQTNSSLLTCIAGGLIVYTIYTFDRALESKEDSVNRTELNDSNKKVGVIVSLLAFIIGTYILAKEGLLALPFIPFVIGFLYSENIKIGKLSLKLKRGFGVKNIVVGITWSVLIAGLVGSKDLISIIIVFILYGVKVFINSTIDDFKDVKGDAQAGIKTLPIILGETNTRTLLLSLHVFSHLILSIALIKGVIAFEPLIIMCSFVFGLICIQYVNGKYWESRKLKLMFFKDGESPISIILRYIANMVLA